MLLFAYGSHACPYGDWSKEEKLTYVGGLFSCSLQVNFSSILGRSGKLAMTSGGDRYGFASNNGFGDLIMQNQTGTAGEGHAHNNMPPYKAINVWERTA